MYEPLMDLPFQRKEDLEKIFISLGQVVQLSIHFSQALNLVLNNPMIFNGKRSLIFSC
jgi:hypothetical protein